LTHTYTLFATAPLGLELLLADELHALGMNEVKAARSGVYFEGELAQGYRACLWSRLANRVLLKLAEFPAGTPEALYDGVSALDWSEHMEAEGTLTVDFVSQRSQITHTQFGAQKVKDAIVDQFRERTGSRPSVDMHRPDLRINVYLERDQAVLSLDLAGDSLHKRGYRLDGVSAPLKENLAAALLLRAGWPEVYAAGGDFIDPMCGSGTLLVEAAWMAADVAPGLLRESFGFMGWKQHDRSLWYALLDEALARREQGLAKFNASIVGCDIDRSAIHAALANVERAGLADKVEVEQRSVVDARPRKTFGLLLVNPPYGERLGDIETLVPLYTDLGNTLREHFQGWKASVFTGNVDLAFKLGIRSHKKYALYNGALECKLFNFDVDASRFFEPHADESGLSEEARALNRLLRRARALALKPEQGQGAEMFANRVRKNLKNLGRWARQQGISCYRLYDADLPEYAVAVDLYYSEQENRTWLNVQEYEAPASIDADKAETRLIEVLAVLPPVLEIPPEQVFLKVRRKQKGVSQYEKQAEVGHYHQVTEGGCRFWVNFQDYLDTGLFLDHRSTRLMIQAHAEEKRFLNLFAYTGTASVHAAVGGALSTTTVDMSRTYLDWARRNMALNAQHGYAHEFIQADCLAWLAAESARPVSLFDLIFLDPPTFSNSARMSNSFDIQRDHVTLLRQTVQLLAPEGELIFSTNFRRFKLDSAALADLEINDISARTIPRDFERNARIHYCWIIKRK
jgi:23S rRNA (guanine2445-N2)-methyltransferase / 23S rRNA (guanine2069-N7)-methyltransferase